MAATEISKQHAACDGCRTRKMKCPGQAPACSACLQRGRPCVYSAQRPMGRPRKRKAGDSDAGDAREYQYRFKTAVEFTDAYRKMRDESTVGENQHVLGTYRSSMPFTEFEVVPSHEEWPALDDIYAAPQNGDKTASERTPIDGMGSMVGLPAQTLMPPPETPSVDGTITGHVALDMDVLATSTCACLASMYLSLSTLQSMTDLTFPGPLHLLREALGSASGVLVCEHCPTSFVTSIQNVQLMNLFLLCAAARYKQVLTAVDLDVTKAVLAKQTKILRVGDLRRANTHLHHAEPDSSTQHFDVDLDPYEWGKMAKRIVKEEVAGQQDDGCTSLLELIHGFKRRQSRQHIKGPPPDWPRKLTAEDIRLCFSEHASPECVRLSIEAEKVIEGMLFE